MKVVNMQSIILLAGLAAASSAYAKRGDSREGFNFGTSMRLLDDSDRTNPNDQTDKAVKTESSDQSFSPYLGYSFGAFNLGLVGNVGQRNLKIQEHSTNGAQENNRNTMTSVRSLSLFARFLFGKVLYFEVGGGVYSEDVSVHNESTMAGDAGSFTGQKEDYSISGTGPGYHVGGGLEIPITGGFYFTSSYLVKIYQLRDMSKGVLGSKMAVDQRRELMFGIAYYYN